MSKEGKECPGCGSLMNESGCPGCTGGGYPPGVYTIYVLNPQGEWQEYATPKNDAELDAECEYLSKYGIEFDVSGPGFDQPFDDDLYVSDLVEDSYWLDDEPEDECPF